MPFKQENFFKRLQDYTLNFVPIDPFSPLLHYYLFIYKCIYIQYKYTV